MDQDIKVISQAMGSAYKNSEPDILPDVAAYTILYELQRAGRISEFTDNDCARIRDKIEMVLANPHSVAEEGEGLSSQLKSILVSSGLLK